MSVERYRCLKTGANLLIAGNLCHGDLFQLGNNFVFRCVTEDPHPPALGTFIHGNFDTWHEWYDRQHTCGETPSTVILGTPVWYLYEGREVLS